MRKQISWMLKGQAQTRAALDDHAAAIRELQQKVAELTVVVARLDPLATGAGKLPGELRAAVDDLGARIGALGERLEEVERAGAGGHG